MNPQDALWQLPNALGNSWWLICAMFSLPAAALMMLKLIINEPLSLLTISRTVIVASLVAFGMTPLNSGWLPWGVLLASVGGFMAAVLLTTGWCNRADQRIRTLPRVLWQWLTGQEPRNGHGD